MLAVDRDEVPHIADILNVMQERFMMYGTHSPINWAQKLRSFGKQINEITTSLGYISWTDDDEHLSYKGLELGMIDLKKFNGVVDATARGARHNLLCSPRDCVTNAPWWTPRAVVFATRLCGQRLVV